MEALELHKEETDKLEDMDGVKTEGKASREGAGHSFLSQSEV